MTKKRKAFKNPSSRVGHVLRQLREKEYTAESFSLEMGFSINYWGQLERGDSPINLDVLEKACKKLKKSMGWVMSEADKLI